MGWRHEQATIDRHYGSSRSLCRALRRQPARFWLLRKTVANASPASTKLQPPEPKRPAQACQAAGGHGVSGMFAEKVERTTNKSVEWYTPAWVFHELGLKFDLDPASPHDMQTFVPAETKYTIFDNGLAKEWFGRVWLNPPYGTETPFWMRRMVDHGDGIAMVFSRTDAAWFQEAMRECSAILFMSGRIEFVPGIENKHKKSRSGAGTAMLAFGFDNAIALSKLSSRGIFIPRNLGGSAA